MSFVSCVSLLAAAGWFYIVIHWACCKQLAFFWYYLDIIIFKICGLSDWACHSRFMEYLSYEFRCACGWTVWKYVQILMFKFVHYSAGLAKAQEAITPDVPNTPNCCCTCENCTGYVKWKRRDEWQHVCQWIGSKSSLQEKIQSEFAKAKRLPTYSLQLLSIQLSQTVFAIMAPLVKIGIMPVIK